MMFKVIWENGQPQLYLKKKYNKVGRRGTARALVIKRLRYWHRNKKIQRLNRESRNKPQSIMDISTHDKGGMSN